MSTSDRADLEALLPFWVNDTLTKAERDRVEQALAEDADLRARAEVLHRVRVTLREDVVALRGPGELGLARLNRALDAETRTMLEIPEVPANATRLWPRQAVWALGSAIAASLATVVFLGSDPEPAPVYEQASGEAAGLIVVFAPGAPMGEIETLLRAQGLTIEDGPSALGLYRLTRFPGDETPLDDLAQKLEEDERILRVDIDE